MEELVPVAGSFRGENDAEVAVHFDQLRWRKQRQWVVMWPRPRLSGARVFERLRMRKVWYTLGHRHARGVTRSQLGLAHTAAARVRALPFDFLPGGMQTKPYPEQRTFCGTQWFSSSFP